MWFLRRKSAGGPVAGAPASRHPASTALRRLALAGLALATLGLEGCQSGGCDSCGTGLGSGIASSLNRMGQSVQSATSRIFNCKKCKGAGGDCCGGAVVEGAPISGGGVIIEGSQGTVVPGPPPSAPIMDDRKPPRILNPATPNGASAVDPMGLGDRGRQSASLYRSRSIDSSVRGRGDDLARTSTSPSVNTRRSTSASMLDNLPPVGDLPEEVARRSTSPIPPEADRAKPAAEPAPITPTLPSVASARDAEMPAIKASVDTSTTPGIRRILSVRPKVSGGSLPSLIGLDWLKESGIKTLIDLRISNEVDPTFAEAVKARGFRYVALSIDTAKPEPEKIARFHDELGKTEGQPLYFFDNDGRRAGLMWYVHGLAYKSIDLSTANRDATELGLTDRATWLAAASYLDAAKSLATGNADARPQPGPSASNGPSTLSSPLASWTRQTVSGSAANPVEAAR
jgi:hypothetical protein